MEQKEDRKVGKGKLPAFSFYSYSFNSICAFRPVKLGCADYNHRFSGHLVAEIIFVIFEGIEEAWMNEIKMIAVTPKNVAKSKPLKGN
jgi:hypothetical protein